MKITRAALVVAVAVLAGFVTLLVDARGDERAEVTIRVSVPGADAAAHGAGTDEEGKLGLTLVPDPLVIVRGRPAGATWRLDAAAQGIGSMVEISFEDDSPFTAARIRGPARGAIVLGEPRDAVALGTFPYAARLLDGEGGVIATGHGRIEIEEPAGIPRLAILIVCVVGVLFLISNYVEREPLTRSYEAETDH
jgi:hypothetical protein